MKEPNTLRGSRRGFTLIELVVVVSILAILAGVLVPRVSSHMAAARDARRLADVEVIRTAIEQYYSDRGAYPVPDQNPSYGGWDVSHDGNFLTVLSEAGYLEEGRIDPVNDQTHHYRYFVYTAGSYGCVGGQEFFVLGIRNFESPEFAMKNQGFFKCKNRDWGKEFAYVTGGGTHPQG